MARPNVQEAMKARGITPVWDKPSEFDAYVKVFVTDPKPAAEDAPSQSGPRSRTPPPRNR